MKTIDFTTIDYLKTGTNRQKQAYKTLKSLRIFENLKRYNPLLTGTLPIDIDLPESDLDIICQCKDHSEFARKLSDLFANKPNFKLDTSEAQNRAVTTATFRTEHFEIEIFGQNLPTVQQRAFRHMLVEYQLLKQKGAEFKAKVKRLKATGLKTEPAFAKLLGLEGDPYQALLYHF